jgi:predicted DNA-binding transcriptional regulator AlpA
MLDFQILDIDDAAAILCISRATLRRVMKSDASFPRPLRIGLRRIGWRRDELHQWLEGRERA